MVKTCTRCLYTARHPLGITFDAEGVCSGCRIHEEKDVLDWDARWDRLEEIIAPYRSSEARYDCIVPVSGAKDAHFILDTVVNRLGLKPLVVAYNKYFNTPTGINNLANLRIKFDVDFQLKNVNPDVVKRLTRSSLYKYGNMYWPVLAGDSVFPVQTAVMMNIPLIIWGAHQGLEQVGQFSHTHEVEMTRRYRKDHDLFGVDASDIVGPFDDLTQEDTLNYRYPAFSDIQAKKVRGIYLGNYIRWDPLVQHQKMVKDYGFTGRPMARLFDPYDHADCFAYSGVHDLLKYFKHGYGKVRDQACREIRHGRLSRKEAAVAVYYYENQPPADMELFADWLGVEPSTLKFVLNRHRNPEIWREDAPNTWTRRPGTGAAEELEDVSGIDLSGPPPTLALQYPGCVTLDETADYITIGRGLDYPEQPAKPALPLQYL